jgi:hypothetical protein
MRYCASFCVPCYDSQSEIFETNTYGTGLLCNVTSYRLVEMYRCFGGTYYPNFRCRIVAEIYRLLEEPAVYFECEFGSTKRR